MKSRGVEVLELRCGDPMDSELSLDEADRAVMARYADPEPFVKGEAAEFREWALRLCLEWKVIEKPPFRASSPPRTLCWYRHRDSKVWIRQWLPDKKRTQARWLAEALQLTLEAGPGEWVARDLLDLADGSHGTIAVHVAVAETCEEAIVKCAMKRWRATRGRG